MKNEASCEYDDIIDLPHHVSDTHAHMPRRDRAAQFAPYAALTGYGALVDETAQMFGRNAVGDYERTEFQDGEHIEN
jgi:hypothetical protein